MMKRQGLVVFSRGPPRDSGLAFGSDGPLPVGVVFFPSFPFMGVMLLMSLKVIYFQSIFLIDFYLKRLIYMQKYGITQQTTMQ